MPPQTHRNYETLKITTDMRGLMTLALNRPQVRNAFNKKMIDELISVFNFEAMDSKIKGVVLRGEGSVFCAGGDLNWMRQSIELDYDQNLEETRQLAKMFETLNFYPKPLLGLVQGAAIGGGVGLVSVCDCVIASAETMFSLSEVRLGIVPACIGPFVVAKIGASHARRFFMSAERFNAAQAFGMGLVHEVVKSPEELDGIAEKMIKNILQCGPKAMEAAKQLVLNLSWPERRQEQTDCLEYVSIALAHLRVSEEGQEGVRAFLEKRKPTWISK
jgi:methylglutaconyl-CoA hydratase